MNIPHHRATVDSVDWSIPIRACLIPTPGWKLLSVDLGQEEPRIVAVIANDKTLLQGFADGLDIYRPATEALYPYTADGTADREWKSRWDAHERFVGKTFFLAWYYGAGAGRLLIMDPNLTQVDISRGLALLNKAHPARTAYLDDVQKSLDTSAYVSSLFGRKRWLYKAWSPIPELKGEALREGANCRIQSTAADILKIAMPTIHGSLSALGLRGHLVSTVHDEVVLECPPTEVHTIHTLVADTFRPLLSGLDLEVEAFVGDDWGHMERI